MDVNKRIDELLAQRKMTYYQLAQVTGIPQTTLANMHTRGSVPTIYTLECICRGLNITMSQFFTDGTCGDASMTREQEEFMNYYILLSKNQQHLLLELAKEFAEQN